MNSVTQFRVSKSPPGERRAAHLTLRTEDGKESRFSIPIAILSRLNNELIDVESDLRGLITHESDL